MSAYWESLSYLVYSKKSFELGVSCSGLGDSYMIMDLSFWVTGGNLGLLFACLSFSVLDGTSQLVHDSQLLYHWAYSSLYVLMIVQNYGMTHVYCMINWKPLRFCYLKNHFLDFSLDPLLSPYPLLLCVHSTIPSFSLHFHQGWNNINNIIKFSFFPF